MTYICVVDKGGGGNGRADQPIEDHAAIAGARGPFLCAWGRMSGMNDKPKPKRRWFRFSLRILLPFVTFASAGFGWLGMKMRQAEQRRVTVEAIRKLGGDVEYDYERASDGSRFDEASPLIILSKTFEQTEKSERWRKPN